MSNYQNEYVLLARTLMQQKVDVAAMFSVLGGGFNYKLVKEQPDVAQYMMDFNHWYNPKNAKAVAMSKQVEAKGGLFTFEVYLSYNCIMLYADALQRAGNGRQGKGHRGAGVEHLVPGNHALRPDQVRQRPERRRSWCPAAGVQDRHRRGLARTSSRRPSRSSRGRR